MCNTTHTGDMMKYININPSKRQTQRIRGKGVNGIKKKIYAVCPPPFKWNENSNIALKHCPLRGIRLNNGKMAYRVDYVVYDNITYPSEWYTTED
tara:strand:+ start:493 stop:777 length:285 start_codon:yes stop_codon:yes gene_type:complete